MQRAREKAPGISILPSGGCSGGIGSAGAAVVMTTTRTLPITSGQCRAGRKLLGWNGLDLAHEAGVDAVALIRFETKSGPLSEDDRKAIQSSLEHAGVVLVADGVRLRTGLSAGKADA
jgi:hypothetical protein